MKRRAIAILAASCLTSASALAAPPEVEALWAGVQGVHSVQATFTSVQTRAILTAPQSASGELLWASPDRLVWRWHTPMPAVFQMNGSVVGMSYPQLDVHERIDLQDNEQVHRLARSIGVWLADDIAAVEKDYEVSWVEGRVVLVPRDATLAGLFAQLSIEFGGEPARPARIALLEPDGDRLDIELVTYQANPSIPDDAFDLPP